MKTIALYAFCLFFAGAGIGHFLLEPFFIQAMPEWVPFRKAIVYISGVVEILLALGLFLKPTRERAGVLIAIFLVVVFPVNVYMALTPENFDLPPAALWIRLPLQVVLIWWVLKVRK
ncbi:DoxX family protein [Sporosarcina gallistercoris]|uniref:DoxX family protein n=1 Tax=Sporosarcina gallistercoris TaxID=2762245 RepID=A0ABR8PJE4_9BACL|nr:DoxX family protein [Sporosarcina gallistercoris]MBD7908199.1 DoxX family protein [Sporosarcina gallistercoris]